MKHLALLCAMLVAVAVAGSALFAENIVGPAYYLPNVIMAVAFTPPTVLIVVLIVAFLVGISVWNPANSTTSRGTEGTHRAYRKVDVNSALSRAGDGGHSAVHTSVVGRMIVVVALILTMLMTWARAFADLVAGGASRWNLAALPQPS